MSQCDVEFFFLSLVVCSHLMGVKSELCFVETTQGVTTTVATESTTEQTTQQTTQQTLQQTKQQTTQQTTQQATQSQSCECPCSTVTNITISEVALEEKVNRLKKELSVNKKNTSAHRRSKISVPDHRVSATSIGSMGVVILSVVLGSICLMDLTRVRCDKMNTRCCKTKSKKISDVDVSDIMLNKMTSTPPSSRTDQVDWCQ
jgi:cytoskeletal protein RodZ